MMTLPDLPPDTKELAARKQEVKKALGVKPNAIAAMIVHGVVFDEHEDVISLLNKRTKALGELQKKQSELSGERIKEQREKKPSNRIKKLEQEISKKQQALRTIEDDLQRKTEQLQKAEHYLTDKADKNLELAKGRLGSLKELQAQAQNHDKQVRDEFANVAAQIGVLDKTVPLSIEQQQDRRLLAAQYEELRSWAWEWYRVKQEVEKTEQEIDKAIQERERSLRKVHDACDPTRELKQQEGIPAEFSPDDAKAFFKKNVGTIWLEVHGKLEDMKRGGQHAKQVEHILRLMKSKSMLKGAGQFGEELFEEFLDGLTREDMYVLSVAFSHIDSAQRNIKGKNPALAKKPEISTAKTAEERKKKSEAFSRNLALLIDKSPDTFDEDTVAVDRLKVILDANRNNSPFWQKLVSELKKDLADHGNAGMLLSADDEWTLYDMVTALQVLGYVHGSYEEVDADQVNAGAQPDIVAPSSPRELARALGEPDVSKLLTRMTTEYKIYKSDNKDAYRIIHAFMHEHRNEVAFQDMLQQPPDEAAQSEKFQALFEKQSEWLTPQDIADFIDVLVANSVAGAQTDDFWRNLVILASGEHENLADPEKRGQIITPGIATTSHQGNMTLVLQGRLSSNAATREYLQQQIDELSKQAGSTTTFVDELHELRMKLDALNRDDEQIRTDLNKVSQELSSGHVIGQHAKYRGGASLEGIMNAFRIMGVLSEDSNGDIHITKWVPDANDLSRVAGNAEAVRSLHWFIHATRMYEDLPVQSEAIIKQKRERERRDELESLTAVGIAAAAFTSAGLVGALKNKFDATRENAARKELEHIDQLVWKVGALKADTYGAIAARRFQLEAMRVSFGRLDEYIKTLPDKRKEELESVMDDIRSRIDALADAFEAAYYQSLADAIGERLKVVAADIATANLRDPISEKEVHDAQRGVEESVKQFDELSEQHDRRFSMIPDNPDHAAERKTVGDILDVAHDNITTVWNDALALESHFVSENLDTLRGEVESGLPDSKVEAVKMAQRIGQGFLRVKRFSDDVERRKDSDIFQGLDMDRAIEETRFQEEIDEIGTEYVQLLKQAGTRFGNDVIESLSGFTAPIDAYQYRWLGLDKKPDSGDDARFVAARPDDRPPRPSGKPKRGKTFEEITKNIECPPEVRERIIDRLIHSLNEHGFSGSFPKDVRGILIAESGEVADTGVAFSILELSDIADELMQANFGRHYERYDSDNPEHRLVAAYMRANLSAWMDEAERTIKADEENEIDTSDLLDELSEISATPKQVDEIVSLFAEKGFETSPERSDYINVLNALKNNDFRPLGEILWKVFEILTGKSRDQLVKTENRDLLAHTAQYLLESEGDSNPARIVEWIIAAREKQKTPMASFDEKIAKRFQERISVSFPATVLISGPKDPSLRFSTFTDNLHNILREILNTCGSVKVVTEPTFRTKEGDHENEASFTNLEVKNIPYGPMGLLKISATFTGKIGVERETSGQIYVHLMVDPVEIHAPFNLGDSITPAEISDALFKNLYNTDARQKLARYLDTL